MTKRKQRATKRPPPATSVLLDRFTEEQLDDWSRGGEVLQGLADKIYFELEQQRASKYAEICDALRSSPPVSVNVDQWCRVTDWQWTLTPLSPAGSIKDIGGRFNIGATLDRARGQAFPCVTGRERRDCLCRIFWQRTINGRGTSSIERICVAACNVFRDVSLEGSN